MREAGLDVEVEVLADEARVVLGPWLQSLRSGRPRVIWAYQAVEGGARSIGRQQFDALAVGPGVDAVLDAAGRLEEGRPGQHGVQAFSLPHEIDDGPALALERLYESGARTVMLDGGRELAEPFVERGLVDEICLYVGETSPSSIPSAGGPLLPEDFRIRSVRRVAEGVVVTATRQGIPDH
jgi:diaminohydroxyphosphoribosylaminopyrimidine deaminase/5-amino-6-(5-phosphoribosylamino)uracil reductase